MKSAVTICLVPEAARGPFVFHGGLEAGLRAAAEVGFDGVEIFPAAASQLQPHELRRLLAAHGLALAAVGTGAGRVVHGLDFMAADETARRRALEFAGALVDAAGELGAPAIVGSMQGRAAGDLPLGAARGRLADALDALARRAATHGQVVLYEPLNRYETDLFNHLADAAAFLDAAGLGGVRLLADLFHMNIEEDDLGAALAACGPGLGHVHWADSNRRAVGLGHTDVVGAVAALRRIGYAGYLSAEVLPLPTEAEAARQSLASMREHFPT
jgi:sugar phosphate isomerase/epimerase